MENCIVFFFLDFLIINEKCNDSQGLKQKQQERRLRKISLATVFKCCVSGCFYNSINKTDLIQHIIQNHGPYKCIASGCQFVTKSRDLYHMHLVKLHPKVGT